MLCENISMGSFAMASGERIKRAREKAGMTQQQLADAMHVNFTVISQYEHDRRNPKIETLKRIADAIGCSVYELMDPDASSTENFEQIHMFNLRVEELKVQINYYRASGMKHEAESAERELRTLIGNREWSAGSVPENIKTPATGSDGSVDELYQDLMRATEKQRELVRRILNYSPDRVSAFLQITQSLQADQSARGDQE